MSEETENKNKQQLEEQYRRILEQTKKRYKPTLKPMTKNQLINIIVDLSAQVAVYKSSTKEELTSQIKEESNE